MVTTSLQTKIRPFSFDDSQAVIDLFNAYSRDIQGVDDTDLDEWMNDWTSPGVNAEEMARVVEDDQGQIIGYMDVWDATEPHVVKYLWGVLHPNYWDEQLYNQMLSWAEKHARERIKLAPKDSRVVMDQSTLSNDLRRKKVLETYGFDLIRHFFTMVIDFEDAPVGPVIPQGLTIVPINIETELKSAAIVIEEGFKDHWGHVDNSIDEIMKQWQHILKTDKDFDPNLMFLAKDEDQIAGVCRCSDKVVEDPNMGWVNQLCVLKSWRRRGLGKALLQTAFKEFYLRGKKRVGLGVDANSLTNATKLYENAGMHKTKQYDTYQMEIRPGNDLSRS